MANRSPHWTCARKRFYDLCLEGLSVQITCNYIMDELDEDNDIEAYISANLSFESPSAIGLTRNWFDCRKFRTMIHNPADNEMVHRVLDYFEDRDLGPINTYAESEIEDEQDDAFAKSFLANRSMSYGWYCLHRRHYFKCWSIVNFWWKESGKNQHAENGRGRMRAREEFEADFGPVVKSPRCE